MGWYGTLRATGPRYRSQSTCSGTEKSAHNPAATASCAEPGHHERPGSVTPAPPGKGAGRGSPCIQIGRLVHTCTSRTTPITPARTHSLTRRASSLEWPWLPIWVTTPADSASRSSSRASCTDQVRGFCT